MDFKNLKESTKEFKILQNAFRTPFATDSHLQGFSLGRKGLKITGVYKYGDSLVCNNDCNSDSSVTNETDTSSPGCFPTWRRTTSHESTPVEVMTSVSGEAAYESSEAKIYCSDFERHEAGRIFELWIDDAGGRAREFAIGKSAPRTIVKSAALWNTDHANFRPRLATVLRFSQRSFSQRASL